MLISKSIWCQFHSCKIGTLYNTGLSSKINFDKIDTIKVCQVHPLYNTSTQVSTQKQYIRIMYLINNNTATSKHCRGRAAKYTSLFVCILHDDKTFVKVSGTLSTIYRDGNYYIHYILTYHHNIKYCYKVRVSFWGNFWRRF